MVVYFTAFPLIFSYSIHHHHCFNPHHTYLTIKTNFFIKKSASPSTLLLTNTDGVTWLHPKNLKLANRKHSIQLSQAVIPTFPHTREVQFEFLFHFSQSVSLSLSLYLLHVPSLYRLVIATTSKFP